MNLQIFKEKLNKGQLEAMAIDTVRKQLESVDALEALEFAKKLKFFSDVLISESEKEAKMVWGQHKQAYPNMSYTQGAAIYDYYQDPIFAELGEKQKQRKILLDAAIKSKDPIYDSDGVEVPKLKVKNYRKDSINVKI